MAHSTSSSGVFSVLFPTPAKGVIVGGNFQDEANRNGTSAISTDSGMNWKPSSIMPGGYRSCVVAVPGTDTDHGRTERIGLLARRGNDLECDRHDRISRRELRRSHQCRLGRGGRGTNWKVCGGGAKIVKSKE